MSAFWCVPVDPPPINVHQRPDISHIRPPRSCGVCSGRGGRRSFPQGGPEVTRPDRPDVGQAFQPDADRIGRSQAVKPDVRASHRNGFRVGRLTGRRPRPRASPSARPVRSAHPCEFLRSSTGTETLHGLANPERLGLSLDAPSGSGKAFGLVSIRIIQGISRRPTHLLRYREPSSERGCLVSATCSGWPRCE
jgi:hypothetical protein